MNIRKHKYFKRRVVGILQAASGITLYRRVKEEIENRIKSREWKVGDQIPNEETLARQWGVSRGTVRQAIQQLCTEGVLSRHQGRGTFVAQPRTVPFSVPDIFYRYTLDEDSPRFRVISQDMAPAPSWVAEQLKQPPETKVFTLHRHRLSGENAASIKTLYFTPHISMERLDGVALELPVVEIITECLGLLVGSVDVTLELITLDMGEVQTLAEEPGCPGMRVVNRYLTPDGTPIIVSETIMPARICRYQFTVPVTPRS